MKTINKVALCALMSGVCAAATAADPVKVPDKVPYAESNDVAGKIKHECRINEQLSEYIVEYAEEHKIATKVVEAADSPMPGRVLGVEGSGGGGGMCGPSLTASAGGRILGWWGRLRGWWRRRR